MSHNISVLMYYGASQFFKAVAEIGHTFVDNTAYCNRLIASRLNLEFSFNGEMKLIADGAELLREVVAAAKAGKFTQSDADFATSQLLRIGLVYNSWRTIYHVQAYAEQASTQSNVDTPVNSSPMVDVNSKIEEKSEQSVQKELTSDNNVANIASVVAEQATAKRGRKAAK